MDQTPVDTTHAARIEIASQILTGIALIAVLRAGLVTALLSGLLIYQLVQLSVPPLRNMGVAPSLRKSVALSIPVIVIIAAATFGVVKLIDFLTGGFDGVVVLLRRMAEILDTARSRLPYWAQTYLPDSTAEVQSAAATWLREHAGQVGNVTQNIGRFFFYLIVGMVIGGIVSMQGPIGPRRPGPLAMALKRRAMILSSAFRNIVFSQIRISALNTLLTSIYLAIILPLFDVHLPLLKTLIAVTFLAGLLPVVGNLISNTVIFIVSLSVSPMVAIAALGYLIFIHKLEYFVNARIIGGRINARAWELLIAMMVMEALFGIPGLIAAPIYYAYLKDELIVRKLI
jgi:predicted PurR-regulated permease PerM